MDFKSKKYGLITLSDDKFESLVNDFRIGKLSDKDYYNMWWNKRTIHHADLLQLNLYISKCSNGLWHNEARDYAIMYNMACILLYENKINKNKFSKSEEFLQSSKKNFEITYSEILHKKTDLISLMKKFPPLSEWVKNKEKIMEIIKKNEKYFSKGLSYILSLFQDSQNQKEKPKVTHTFKYDNYLRGNRRADLEPQFEPQAAARMEGAEETHYGADLGNDVYLEDEGQINNRQETI